MAKLDLEKMRIAGSILCDTLLVLTEYFIKPGVSALDISRKAEEVITSYPGAVPAFKGYRDFPEAACVSVNDQVVHGIPTANLIIGEGDLVSVDCGVQFEGHFSDACRTVAVGDVDPRARKLIKVTREAMDKGIQAAKPGNRIGDISYAIQRHVERHRFRVSLEFVGHGIGLELHGSPCVPNYGPPGLGQVIKPGTCLAIEPVVFDGPADAKLGDDGWTVYSKYGNLSAHYEETILVTEDGPEILTRRRDNAENPGTPTRVNPSGSGV